MQHQISFPLIKNWKKKPVFKRSHDDRQNSPTSPLEHQPSPASSSSLRSNWDKSDVMSTIEYMERRLRMIALTADVFLMQLDKLAEAPHLPRGRDVFYSLASHCFQNKLTLDVCNADYKNDEIDLADEIDPFHAGEWFVGRVLLSPKEQSKTAYPQIFLPMEDIALKLSDSRGTSDEPMRFRVGFRETEPPLKSLKDCGFYDPIGIGQYQGELDLVFQMDGRLDGENDDDTLHPETWNNLIDNEMTMRHFLRGGVKHHHQLAEFDFNMCLCCFAIAYEKLTREQFVLNEYSPSDQQAVVLNECLKHIGTMLKPSFDPDEGFEGFGVGDWFE